MEWDEAIFILSVLIAFYVMGIAEILSEANRRRR